MSGDMVIRVDKHVAIAERTMTDELTAHYPFFGSIRFNFQDGKLVNANIERTIKP